MVPWKRRLGYATLALAQILPEAQSIGLPYVEITTDLENIASQKVIVANGGVLVERFTKGPQYGSKPSLRFRITLV
jgi:predicted acetyltransferase